MAGIETSIKLHDGVSPVLQKISRTLDAVTNRFAKLQGSLSKGLTANAGATSAEYANINEQLTKINSRLATISKTSDRINGSIRKGTNTLNGTLTAMYKANINQIRLNSLFKECALHGIKVIATRRQIGRVIDQNSKSQRKFNEYVRGGVNESHKLLSNLKNAFGVYLGFQSVGNVIKLADNLTSTRARIDLINKGLYTTDEVMRKVYESAMRSRGSYMEMADAVSKMAMRAPSIFTGGIDEVIAFTETINKMAVISGAEVQELNSAILQITQALGAGVMRGDEFKSVVENLPVANQAVADYLKVAVDHITELAHDGKITADIFKNGILSAANDISKKMGGMKWTWAQVWEVFKNSATMAFDGVLGKLSDIANSDRFKSFMSGVGKAMVRVAEIVTDVFELITKVGAWLHDNWRNITPAIQSVIAAVITLKTAMLVGAAILALYNLYCGVMAAKSAMAAGATFLQATQQYTLNSALLACPWVWVVGGILAMIAVIGTIIAYTYDWENCTIDFRQTMVNVMGAIKKAVMKVARWLKIAWLYAFDKIKIAALYVWDILKGIGDFFVSNWSIFAPIVWGIVGAFVAYKTALIAISVWHGICAAATLLWKGIVLVATFVMSLFNAATWAQIWANIKLAVTGWAASSPLLFWIIVIVAIIALFYVIIACINKFCGTSISATGIICAAFMALYTRIYNIFVYLWNYVATFVEFFQNVFSNPIYSVKALFVNLAVNVIDCLISMTRGCDKFATAFANAILWAVNKAIEGWNSFVDMLPEFIKSKLGLGKGTQIEARTSFTSDLESAKAGLQGLLGDKPADYKTTKKLEYKDLGESIQSGYNWGKNLEDSVTSGASDLLAKTKGKLGDLIAMKDLAKTGNATNDPAGDLGKALGGGFDNPALDKIAGNTGKIAGNTGKTAANTSSSDEDLKYMRELAEREAINRYTLTDLKVEMNNNNNINNGMDIDEVMSHFGRKLYSAVKNTAQAAHF